MSVDTVRNHLARFNAAERMRVLPGSIATVELAAAGLGVEPDLIAKTLGVRVKGTDRVMVIVAKGTARLDNAKFKQTFSGKAAFISVEECLAVTGHPPGGVCPFGLADGVEVYLDESLKAFPTVYPAAGAPDNCVETTLEELEAWTGGRWVDVCK
ncbi:MAG: YbaK/EbsC family protein [Planctomycetaceae bacterium]|nr:YbaK/EbsC family protein [Planctomycetaceae bacterium]